MNDLYVFYDAGCGLCCRFSHWLERQASILRLRCLAYQSEEAARVFPDLGKHRPGEEILVLADTGELYRGGDAWIICLWATREHRSLAMTMATPALRPLARRIAFTVSRHRRRFSQWLRIEAEVRPDRIAEALDEEPVRCAGAS